MLSVENLRSSYGRIEALHGVSIVVAAGEIVTLLGANGAGKTTLLRAISGVQPISAGSIRFEDRAGRLPARSCAGRPRHLTGTGRPASVRPAYPSKDNLKLGAWSRRSGDFAPELAYVYGLFPMLDRAANTPPPARCPAVSSRCSLSAVR